MDTIRPSRPAILIPLYIYPDPEAWGPLYEVIVGHPAQIFVTVVNPHNGPGAGVEPDENYAREIARLNSYNNVCTVGYVATSWGKRKLAAVLGDVSKYAGWSTNASLLGLGMQGIFFDEAPSKYDESSAEVLRAAHAAVRSMPAFRPRNMVVDNPGTIPDQRYLEDSDISVVFEGTHETFQTHNVGQAIRSMSHGTSNHSSNDQMASRTRLACIMHSVPQDLAKNQLREIVQELKELAACVYIVDLSVDYYCSFGSSWGAFAAEMARS